MKTVLYHCDLCGIKVIHGELYVAIGCSLELCKVCCDRINIAVRESVNKVVDDIKAEANKRSSTARCGSAMLFQSLSESDKTK